MAVAQLVIHILLSLFQGLPMVGDDLDKATHDHMQEREKMLSCEMTRLLREIEQRGLVLRGMKQRGLLQKIQEQHQFGWNALVFAALQQWQFWVVVEVLVLLFGLWWWFRKRSYNRKQVKEEEKKENNDTNGHGRFSKEYPHWPVQDMARQRKEAEYLVLSFIHKIRQLPLNSFFPVLQPPIGVGSTFEGWSLLEDDSVYRFLVPLKAPWGYAFKMVLCSTRGKRNFCIDVETECTCMVQQRVGKIQCLLHQSKEELKRNQVQTLLDTVCTASFLDAQKIAHWFSQNVEEIWKALPQSSQCCLRVLPSKRSCKFQVTNISHKILSIEIIFGVQVRDSDIFLSSQSTEDNPATKMIWPESSAVAEVKFFRHIATQAPPNSVHLKCLQACTRILKGTSFSTYTFKTIVMHLLTDTSLSNWSRKNFVPRLQDIMRYLFFCLEKKRLNHFFYHNENVPKEINLPQFFKMGHQLNLFQRYTEDPVAHAEALWDFQKMKTRLKNLPFDTS